MSNQTELERITISTEADACKYRNEKLSDKHIVIMSKARDTEFKHLENCIVEGGKIVCESMYKTKLVGVETVCAHEVVFSIFKKCKNIQLGDIDESYKVDTSRFFDCGTISINDANVEDCIFDNFETLYLTNANMKSCIVENIVCDSDCAISMEDGEMSDISFENIELLNDSYLVEGYGTPWVEDSVFLNIRTSREDRELFHQEETKGLIIKKKKEYCFVDEDSCSGLNLVMDLEGNIDFDRFNGN